MQAVIDIGTNSVLLLLAQREPTEGPGRGRVIVHDDLCRITRLGAGAARTRRLDPEAVQRTLSVLREYRALAERHGARLQAVATEGLRMAEDPETFLEPAARVLGTPVRLIDGDEEAALSFRSVADELVGGPGDAGPRELCVLDIGGGSTELVVGRIDGPDGDPTPRVLDRRSHRIGSVRLTEQHIACDPPTPAELEAVATAARRAFARQPVARQAELHGLAGTVTTVGALLSGLPAYDRARVDGTRWSVAQVRALRDRLAAQTTAERTASPLLPPGRADVIVAGATILLEALLHVGADTLVVRDRGLRYALV